VVIPQSSPLSFNIFFKNSISIESVTSLLSTLITSGTFVINVDDDNSEVTDSMEAECKKFLKKMLNESGDDCGIITYFEKIPFGNIFIL
jgi:3-isopropylmalate dehydratase small subunit